MPRTRAGSVPSYRLHKARNGAVVTIDGHDYYLDPYGTSASQQKYAALIRAWEDRQEKPDAQQDEPLQPNDCPSLNERILAYLKFAPTTGTLTAARARKTTPAMASGLADRVWSVRELLERATQAQAAAGDRVGAWGRINTMRPHYPLPDEYDLLIYAKNGNRPQLLGHLAEVFPRHVQIHYGRYRREELCEAARRSRACAYLADDHGPLALQEILLAGCPTVGVRTGASFVQDGVNGVLVERLPPGAMCVANDADEASLSAYVAGIHRSMGIDRPAVRSAACVLFGINRIADQITKALETARTCPYHQIQTGTDGA